MEMNYTLWRDAVAREIAKRLECTQEEALGECEDLIDGYTDGLSPEEQASEIIASMVP